MSEPAQSKAIQPEPAPGEAAGRHFTHMPPAQDPTGLQQEPPAEYGCSSQPQQVASGSGNYLTAASESQPGADTAGSFVVPGGGPTKSAAGQNYVLVSHPAPNHKFVAGQAAPPVDSSARASFFTAFLLGFVAGVGVITTAIVAALLAILVLRTADLLPGIALLSEDEEAYTLYYPQEDSDGLLGDLFRDHHPPRFGDEWSQPRLGLGRNDDLGEAQQFARDATSFFFLSREELIDWLVSDGFTRATAEEAADTVGINYAEVALAAAQDMIDNSSYSAAEIVEELSGPRGRGFTDPEVAYVLEHLQVDWVAEALDQAWLSFEELQLEDSEIRDLLTQSEYTQEQVDQAMERFIQRREEDSRS